MLFQMHSDLLHTCERQNSVKNTGDHWVKLWTCRPLSLLDFSQSCCKFVNLTISGGIGPMQSQDKIVHHGLIWRRGTPSRSLDKIVNLATCQLIRIQPKLLQIHQFGDFERNWSYTKSRQNSEKREMVNWFTAVLLTQRYATPSRS
jgi:hypothetical protein